MANSVVSTQTKAPETKRINLTRPINIKKKEEEQKSEPYALPQEERRMEEESKDVAIKGLYAKILTP